MWGAKADPGPPDSPHKHGECSRVWQQQHHMTDDFLSHDDAFVLRRPVVVQYRAESHIMI